MLGNRSGAWATLVLLACCCCACSARRALSELPSVDRGRFLRHNTNNLDALLHYVVDGGPYVTLSIFNKAYREFAANWAYAITRFGRVRNVLVAAYDDASLVECLNLGFACYNGTSLLQVTASSAPTAVRCADCLPSIATDTVRSCCTNTPQANDAKQLTSKDVS